MCQALIKQFTGTFSSELMALLLNEKDRLHPVSTSHSGKCPFHITLPFKCLDNAFESKSNEHQSEPGVSQLCPLGWSCENSDQRLDTKAMLLWPEGECVQSILRKAQSESPLGQVFMDPDPVSRSAFWLDLQEEVQVIQKQDAEWVTQKHIQGSTDFLKNNCTVHAAWKKRSLFQPTF